MWTRPVSDRCGYLHYGQPYVDALATSSSRGTHGMAIAGACRVGVPIDCGALNRAEVAQRRVASGIDHDRDLCWRAIFDQSVCAPARPDPVLDDCVVLLVYLVAPEYVIDYSAYGGAWRGLSTYKNTFGEHMAVGVLLLGPVRFRRLPWLRYVFLLIAPASPPLAFCHRGGLRCFKPCCIPVWRLLRGKQRLLVYLLVAITFLLESIAFLRFLNHLSAFGSRCHIDRANRFMVIAASCYCESPHPGIWLCRFLDRLKPRSPERLDRNGTARSNRR